MLVDERGFIPVDKQQRTNVAHIFAIGDVVGQPMLAHKAVHEGKVAAEVTAGQKSYFDATVIPSVAYTDPEVAWVGVTENEAKAAGMKYGKGAFPWAASGRSLSLGRDEGVTKVLFDEATDRIIGAGIVGPAAGDLIAEAALAIEMGADAADIGLTIHPHPTLSETVGHGRRGVRGHPHRPLPPQEEVGRRRHAPRHRTSPISAAGVAPWCCARRGGQRRRKSRNAALTSSGWVHPMLCGPSGTSTTVRSAMSRSSRSRAAVASNGRMRSAPHRTANG